MKALVRSDPQLPAAVRFRGPLFAGLCLSVLLPILFATLLWYEIGREHASAAERGELVAQSVRRQLGDRLVWLAATLRAIATDVAAAAEHNVPPTSAAAAQADMLRDIVLLHDGHATDLQGRPADARWLPPRDADARPPGLNIGPPMRTAPSSRWVVPVAWDGIVGWRIGARIDADWFAEVLAGYELGPDAILNLLHGDGVLLARSAANQTYVGTRLDHSPIFDPVHRHQPSGQFLEARTLDGVQRQIVFQRMPHSPLIVLVGTAHRQILAVWWPFAAISFGAVLLIGALWFWLSRAFTRSHAGQAQLLADLQAQSHRAEEARRIACLGDWTWHLDTGQVTWSDEIFAIYGLPARAGAFPVAEIPDFVHPEDRERMRGYFEKMLGGGEPFETEYRIARPDGTIRVVHARGEWVDTTPGRRVLRGIQQDVTELATTRQRLHDAQNEYRYLFENNPMPMWVFDRETLRFLAINDAMLASYGYSREELLAGTVLDIRPAEDVEAVRAAARTDAADRPQGLVWTHLRKDGTRLRAAIHSHDIEFEGRRARLVLALDVTERERNDQRFQLIARATNDAIWDWDVEAGTTWRSDSYFVLFGYAREDVEPNLKGWADLIHPDDRVRATTSVQRGIDSDANHWEERFRFRRKDGSYADVLDRGALLRNAHGRVTRAVGGMIDITQRNRDEIDLRLLRRAVESADNGIVVADARLPGMPAVYVNHAFEKMSGYDADELLGSSFHFLLEGTESEQPEVAAIRRAIAEQREVRVLLRDHRKDGQMFWNDFYLAPVRDDIGALTHFVSIQSDVTERQRAQEQLAFRATHDELTGLPNRQLLVDRLQQSLLNAERHARTIAVLFVDLDEFKLINDSLGHTAGDATLRAVARRLETAVGDTDTVARFGGDEFVIVLTERTDDRGVAMAITCVNAALAKPFDLSGVSHYISASIGWCRSPEAGTTAEAMLMHADLAMYKAKQGGRNCVVAYQPAFDTQVSARLRLVSELRLALEREEFVLAFQPLFDMGGAPVALEALVRWQHPGQGLLLPGHFISVCEESGLIVPLGRWVLHEAARNHAVLATQGFGHLRIAVNVSALQFQQDLYADVESAMRSHALPRGVLELELTESVIMANPESAIDVMRRLDDMGVSISVDDFGTGYSSLAYLKRLPIDRLKIDRTFVRDLGHDDDDEAICTSIIRLAHSLGLGTVAEGVETQAQLEWLRERGCDEVQGYLLGRPEPFEAMLAGIRKTTPA